MIMCCPYCKKAVGLEIDVSGVNVKEKKVNQKTYEEIKNRNNGCEKSFKKEDRTCGDSYGYRKDEKRNYIKGKNSFDIWLCNKCVKEDST